MHTYTYIHNSEDMWPVRNDIVVIESPTYQKMVLRLRDPVYIYIYIYIYPHTSSYMGTCQSGRELLPIIGGQTV